MVDKLSIIIPTLNEEKYLPKLLESIAKQSFNGKLQVIVVDGNSKDRTIEVVKKFKDKITDLLILKTRTNLGYQRNFAVKRAKYEHVLFIDADIILPKNLLNKFIRKINPDKKVIESSWFMPIWDGSIINYLSFIIAHFLIGAFSFIKPITSGGFMLTTKKSHKEIGGFKEGAVAGEDVDFGRRSIKNGAKFKFHYDCFVYNSTRRAKLMGLIPMSWFYLKGFFYFEKYGVLYDKKRFNYPYGQYEIGEKIIEPSPAPVPA